MKHIYSALFISFLILISINKLNAQNWLTTGNTGLTGSNYIGTKDAAALIFKTNAKERGRILNNGSWQIGLNANNNAFVDSLGHLSFNGKGGYNVGDNRYIFHYSNDTIKGLYLNTSSNQYQFRNSSKTAIFFVNADNGNSGVVGTFKIGAYTLPKADGTNGQVLKTNGAGVVSWGTVSGASNSGWLLTGNAGTAAGTFLGTTDSKALIFKTQNKERIHIKATGEIGIGTPNPKGALNIIGTLPVSLASAGYLQLGDSTNSNLGIDFNQIQARFNGSYNSLYLNYNGGTTYLGNTANSYYGAVVFGSNYGIYGSSTYTGVYGTGNSYGLSGYSSGTGVYGSGGTYGGYFYNASGRGLEGYDAGTNGQGVFAYEAGSGEALHAEAYGGTGYGVYGYSANYYGVVGITSNAASYAGYFQGNVFCTGSYVGSDQKLKQNIIDVSGAMSLIKKLQPKIYEFRNDGNYKLMNLPQGKHYGLIAQDVEKILPGLVKETSTDVSRLSQLPESALDTNSISKKVVAKTPEIIDFKALNYTELIPIMIKGMQEQQFVIDKQQTQISEQQQQIDDLKEMVKSIMNGSNVSSSKINSINNQSAYLLQNAPNPFSQNTTVKCNVPVAVQSAQIIIYSNDGKQLKNYSLQKGMNTITIEAGSLSSGSYPYSLLVDGKTVDTKTMIITK